MTNSDGIHDGRPSRSLRLAGWIASALVTVGVAVGAAFVSSLIAQAADGGPATAATGTSCDQDGVTVGYDVRFRSSIAAYAVSGIRVLDLAPACDGSTIVVQLAGADGTALPDATLSSTVSGASLRLPVAGAVAAAAVARVSVSLEGRTTVVEPPPATDTTPQAPPTAPALTLPVAPSLCPTVSGEVAAFGRPSECGSVVSTPLRAATASSLVVASWPAGVFGDTVRVTLATPVAAALPVLSRGANGTFVKLDVTRLSTGDDVTRWDGAMALDFPAQTGSFVAAYSEDGTVWHTMQQLDAPELPADRVDGYYVHPDRMVTVYTRHATFFGLAPPPQRVRLVHAKLLPAGAVRLTWTPTVAGLGVQRYWILRGGRRIAVVEGDRTRAILRGLPARSSIGVLAVDPLGDRSDARSIPVRIPLLVGAGLEAANGPTVRAHVRLTAPASVRVLVLTRRGAKLTVLPGSSFGSHGAVHAGPELGAAGLRTGSYRLVLRVRLPHRAGPYRVVVLAQGKGGGADRAEIRVAAR